jgi:hypothetical protein
MPREFQILNKLGVPNLGLIVATIIPALMVVAIPPAIAPRISEVRGFRLANCLRGARMRSNSGLCD